MNASMPRDNILILRMKGSDTRHLPDPVPATSGQGAPPSARTAFLDTIDAWWIGRDTDDANLLGKVLHTATRSWFGHQGKLQYIPYSIDIERIKSGNRLPARDRTVEIRTVVDFAQRGAVAVVTVLVESPVKQGTVFRGYTTFQLYQADDRWPIVDLAGFNETMEAGN
jgi:hypothetical protein